MPVAFCLASVQHYFPGLTAASNAPTALAALTHSNKGYLLHDSGKQQFVYQLVALAVTLVLAMVGGAIAGFIVKAVRHPSQKALDVDNMFDDEGMMMSMPTCMKLELTLCYLKDCKGHQMTAHRSHLRCFMCSLQCSGRPEARDHAYCTWIRLPWLSISFSILQIDHLLLCIYSVHAVQCCMIMQVIMQSSLIFPQCIADLHMQRLLSFDATQFYHADMFFWPTACTKWQLCAQSSYAL